MLGLEKKWEREKVGLFRIFPLIQSFGEKAFIQDLFWYDLLERRFILFAFLFMLSFSIDAVLLALLQKYEINVKIFKEQFSEFERILK